MPGANRCGPGSMTAITDSTSVIFSMLFQERRSSGNGVDQAKGFRSEARGRLHGGLRGEQEREKQVWGHTPWTRCSHRLLEPAGSHPWDAVPGSRGLSNIILNGSSQENGKAAMPSRPTTLLPTPRMS